ncbi:hypothetical protein BaRGS_00033655 [Batillaria attramentaria]|uniref:Uncharacterized protein n=1 Tax=Batillaria attramentaria TaxID=370345 RepID=A0ABD0JJD2_9CAEN
MRALFIISQGTVITPAGGPNGCGPLIVVARESAHQKAVGAGHTSRDVRVATGSAVAQRWAPLSRLRSGGVRLLVGGCRSSTTFNGGGTTSSPIVITALTCAPLLE